MVAGWNALNLIPPVVRRSDIGWLKKVNLWIYKTDMRSKG